MKNFFTRFKKSPRIFFGLVLINLYSAQAENMKEVAMTKIKWKEVLTDTAYLLLGGILYGAAYNMFLIPGNVYVGGASGIATALYNAGLVHLPIGTMIIIINIPLMLIFTYFYGIRASIKSILGMLISSLAIDITDIIGIFPPGVNAPEENGFLCAVLGAVILGASLGILFSRGYTTGGTDIVGFILKVKYPHFSPSKLIFACDCAIIAFAAVLAGNYMTVLYSAVAVFLFTTVLDMTVSGFEKARLALIFSAEYDEIAEAISAELERGITLLESEGWYTKKEGRAIVCVVKKNEIYRLKTIVRSIDKNAFVVLTEVTQAIGEGFNENGGENVLLYPKRGAKKQM